jgi:hypothetical protein
VQKLVEYYARFPQEKFISKPTGPITWAERISGSGLPGKCIGTQAKHLEQKVYVELLNESDSVVNRLLLNSQIRK